MAKRKLRGRIGPSQSDKDRTAIIKLIERIAIAFEKQTTLMRERGIREKKITDNLKKLLSVFPRKN